MENYKISVIVPSYNVKGFIGRTIDSVCNQTYKNLEIIIVDDGSTDGTQDEIREISKKDERIVTYFKGNEGVTKTRLYGVERATGDYIGFVDADDLLEPNMYETLLSNAIKYSADISHCGYKMIFPNRVVNYYGTGRVVGQENKVKDLLEGKFVEPSLCNKLFKRELFFNLKEKIDGTITNMEDLLMNFYIFKNSNKAVFLDECLYNYMIRKNSASTGKMSLNKVSGPLKVFKIIKEEVKDDSELNLIIDNRIIGNLLQIVLIPGVKNDDKLTEFCKNARTELKRLRPKIKRGQFSKRIKILSFLAVNFPIVYRIAHKIYGQITGSNKKYKI